jgi:hypothetical protein
VALRAVQGAAVNGEQSHLLSLLVNNVVAHSETFQRFRLDDFVVKWGLDKERTFDALINMHMSYIISFYGPNRNRPKLDDDIFMVWVPKEYYLSLKRPEPPVIRTRPLLDRKTRDAIHEKHNGRCVYCGAPSDEIDHVMPLSRGGSNQESNLVAACRHCNRTKSDRLLSELGWRIRHD